MGFACLDELEIIVNAFDPLFILEMQHEVLGLIFAKTPCLNNFS